MLEHTLEPHTAFNVTCLSRKEFESLEEQILCWSTSYKAQVEPTNILLL